MDLLNVPGSHWERHSNSSVTINRTIQNAFLNSLTVILHNSFPRHPNTSWEGVLMVCFWGRKTEPQEVFGCLEFCIFFFWHPGRMVWILEVFRFASSTLRGEVWGVVCLGFEKPRVSVAGCGKFKIDLRGGNKEHDTNKLHFGHLHRKFGEMFFVFGCFFLDFGQNQRFSVVETETEREIFVWQLGGIQKSLCVDNF